MVRLRAADGIVVLVLVEALSALLINNTDNNLNNHLDTRRRNEKKKKERSTSSSSGDKKESVEETESGVSGESLELSSDFSSTESSASGKTKKGRNKHKHPKSSLERSGWRKWHRKCPSCPEDMNKKWRDPSIKWICGAYQRARRSFKSLCMMHYRNCQDGTMFTKIGDHRCVDDAPGDSRPHGDHFFYDYKVDLSGDSSKSDETSKSEESPDSSISLSP